MLTLMAIMALSVGALADGGADVLPTTTLESAAGKAVVLPEALRGGVGLLVVGFSKGSAGAVERSTAQ